MFPHAYLSKVLDPATVAAKKARRRCIRWGCRRKAGSRYHDCNTCHARLKRLKNPARYAYENIKHRAKERHIAFELTFDEFKAFCDRTGYLIHKGKENHSLSIDRIDRHGPYSKDNIRILTYHENISHVHDIKAEDHDPENPF